MLSTPRPHFRCWDTHKWIMMMIIIVIIIIIIIVIRAEFLSSTVFMNVCKFKAYQNISTSAEYL